MHCWHRWQPALAAQVPGRHAFNKWRVLSKRCLHEGSKASQVRML